MLKSNEATILYEFCKLCRFWISSIVLFYILFLLYIFRCFMYRKGYYSQLLRTALYNTYNTKPSYFSDKIYKSNTSQGGWGMAKDDTNHVFHIFSITLATASSLQTLFITITTFSLIWSGNSRQQALWPLMEEGRCRFHGIILKVRIYVRMYANYASLWIGLLNMGLSIHQWLHALMMAFW